MDIAHRILFGTLLKRFLNESVMETLESGVGVGVRVGVGAEVVAGVGAGVVAGEWVRVSK
jgi:hypothetical protein